MRQCVGDVGREELHRSTRDLCHCEAGLVKQVQGFTVTTKYTPLTARATNPNRVSAPGKSSSHRFRSLAAINQHAECPRDRRPLQMGGAADPHESRRKPDRCRVLGAVIHTQPLSLPSDAHLCRL